MKVEELLQNYKTEQELREFAEASYLSLTQLMSKNKQLEDEIEHLKKLVTGAVPLIQKDDSMFKVDSDEVEIAKRELHKLKEKSMGTLELTLEEAKRTEIYSKILSSRLQKEKNDEREVKELNSDQLLAIAESSDKAN